MFDFGFSEMLLVGIVALVVLGPERLPVVAKTAGEWVGKAQRFVAQVKSDIDRETELSELKKIQEEARAIASDVKDSIEKAATQIESDVKSAAGEVEAVGQAVEAEAQSVASQASVETTSSTDLANVYGWGTPDTAPTPQYTWEEPKRFAKRYHSGPSVDELAGEIEKLRRELGMREAQMGGSGRRYAARSRSSRPRIYR